MEPLSAAITINRLRKSKTARWLSLVAGGAILGGAMGIHRAIDNNSQYLPHFETETTTDQGHGDVVAIDFNLDEDHIVGYDVLVRGSRATSETKLHLGSLAIPLAISWSETFDGVVEAAICQKPSQVTVEYDPNTHTADVRIPVEAISICTETDLERRHFTEDNGLGAAPMEALMPYINGLPGMDRVPGIRQAAASNNNLKSTLQNYAEIQAHQLTAKECGPLVWEIDELRDAYRDNVANRVLSVLSLDPEVGREDINVYVGAENVQNPDMPDQDLGYETDYDEYVAEIEAADGVTLNPRGGLEGEEGEEDNEDYEDNLVCEISPNLQTRNQTPANGSMGGQG